MAIEKTCSGRLKSVVLVYCCAVSCAALLLYLWPTDTDKEDVPEIIIEEAHPFSVREEGYVFRQCYNDDERWAIVCVEAKMAGKGPGHYVRSFLPYCEAVVWRRYFPGIVNYVHFSVADLDGLARFLPGGSLQNEGKRALEGMGEGMAFFLVDVGSTDTLAMDARWWLEKLTGESFSDWWVYEQWISERRNRLHWDAEINRFTDE